MSHLQYSILQVVSVGRREVPIEGEGIDKIEQRIIDFDNMDKYEQDFKDVNKV